jgi:hypothetical protein
VSSRDFRVTSNCGCAGDRLQATSIYFLNNNAHSLFSVLDIMKYGKIDLRDSEAGSSGSEVIKDDISTAPHR